MQVIDKGMCDKGLIWDLVTMNVNVINHVILVNNQTMKAVSAGKNWSIN